EAAARHAIGHDPAPACHRPHGRHRRAELLSRGRPHAALERGIGRAPSIQDQAHMTYDFGEFNNWGTLKSVAIRAPEAAFVSQERVDAEWKDLNFPSRPDFPGARREYDAVLKALRGTGADVIALPAGDGLTL